MGTLDRNNHKARCLPKGACNGFFSERRPNARFNGLESSPPARFRRRGWRITKEKQSHKIDVVVALAMAAHACVQRQQVDYNKIPWVVPFYSGQRRYIPGQSHGEMMTTVINLPD